MHTLLLKVEIAGLSAYVAINHTFKSKSVSKTKITAYILLKATITQIFPELFSNGAIKASFVSFGKQGDVLLQFP